MALPRGEARAFDLLHLEAVHRLTAATVAATSVECIYQAALQVLQGALSLDRVAILLSESGGVIHVIASRGLSESFQQAAAGHSPWPPDAVNPEPVVMADVAAGDVLGRLLPAARAEGVHSLAFIPLTYGQKLLGAFLLLSDRPRSFPAEELTLARTVAGNVGFALEKRRLEDELRLSAETLAATLNAVGEGITVQSPDGTLLLANETAARMLGCSSVAELLARGLADVRDRFDLLDEQGRPLATDELPGRAALRGDERPERLVRWRVAATGREHYSLVRGHPVRGDDGAVRFAVNVFRDVTERQVALEALRASEARFAFLADAGRRLMATPLDPVQVLDNVVDVVVPALADWCSVRELGEGQPSARLAFGHRDHDAADLVKHLESYGDIVNRASTLAALRDGQSIMVSEITPAMLEEVTTGAEHLALLRRLDLRSAILVPLRARGRTVGVLSLAADSSRPAYTDADLMLVEELAARVAITVDNARSFAREHATAETLARALLPGRLPAVPGLEMAARYRAAGDVGGDFYDGFATRDGHWMLVVGDVCGRGIRAASLTGLTRHSIRAAALHTSSLPVILRDLNHLLLTAAEQTRAARRPGDEDDPRFCTVCLARVTPTESGARVAVASAGHPLPLLVRRDGAVTEVGRPGSLLGVLDEIAVFDAEVDLGAGDALVLFTDGITERRENGTFFADELRRWLAELAGSSAAVMAERLEDAAVSFATVTPADDMAIVVLSVPTG